MSNHFDGKERKRQTNESFGSESAWEFSARDVSAKDSRSSVWCWKEYNFLPINTKQTKNKKQFMSPSSCTIVKVRTSNGAYFDASMRSSKHACIPVEERRSTVYGGSHLFRQVGISHSVEMIPEGSSALPPHRSLVWDRLVVELLAFIKQNAEPCPAWTTERGKLNEAGHLVTH